jgi:hypothetical protein
MNGSSTSRRGRIAAKSPGSRSPRVHAFFVGLLLSCGTGSGTSAPSVDAGHPAAEGDATSPTEGGTASPDSSFFDSPAVGADAGMADAGTADAGTDGSSGRTVDASTEASGEGGPVSPGGTLAFGADRVIVTGVRGTATPAAQSVITLHNGGKSAVQLTSLSLDGANAALFQVTTAPATIMPGADLQVTVEMTTTGGSLPALPPGPAPYDAGSNLLTATLTATGDSVSAQASVYGLLLVQDNYEPTLGQIITTLGYKLDVGQAQDDWNPNTSMMAADLPGVEPNTDEVAAPLFVKATATGSVTMNVVARFSPVGVLPYGWYPSTSSTTRTTVGTMSMVDDLQTSNKARMVYPPLVAGSATTFDPGTTPFGIWVYSDQKTETWHEMGNPVNGDYDFSQDALNTDNAANTPAVVHRIKTYPLKDATGQVVPQSYMVAVEEAGNGDYQDYVFVLGNVDVAP